MKQRRTHRLVERIEEGFYGSINATGEAISRVNSTLSWSPHQVRYRVLLSALGLAFIALAYFVRDFIDASPLVLSVLGGVAPLVLLTVIGLVARRYLARRQREESIAVRQREMR